MDQEGLIFSNDLLLSLVVITIILGLGAEMMDIYSARIEERVSRNSLEKLTNEAADILIKSQGSPPDWVKLSPEYIKYPGLLKGELNSVRTPSQILSYEKLKKLQKDYDKLVPGKLFPPYIETSIIIYPLNPSLEPIIIHDTWKISLSSDVVVVNRSINCDFNRDKCLIIKNIQTPSPDEVIEVMNSKYTEKCQHFDDFENHSFSDPESKYYWICTYFEIDQSNVQNNDYYLITDSYNTSINAVWIIDQLQSPSKNKNFFKTTPINLNPEIKSIFSNTDFEIFWIHIGINKNSSENFTVYIVELEQNTNPKELKTEYFQIQPCNLVLKAGILF